MKYNFLRFLILFTFKTILTSSNQPSLVIPSSQDLGSLEFPNAKKNIPPITHLSVKELTKPKQDDTSFTSLQREFDILQAEYWRLLKTMQDFVDTREEEIRRRTEQDRNQYQKVSKDYFKKLRETEELEDRIRASNVCLQGELDRTKAKLREREREVVLLEEELATLRGEQKNNFIFVKTKK
jgi:hypothetical protein